MTARKKTPAANPVLDGMVDAPPKPTAAAETARLIVRTVAALGEAPRYRAGLGPFGREPVVVEVTPEQAAALKADAMLAVAEAWGD